MSKSLGNLVLVEQALERAPAAAVRLYLASHHYRRDWEFEWSGLERAARLVERVRALLAGEVRGAGAPDPVAVGAGPKKFVAALADDLNTSAAIRELRAAVRRRDRQAVKAMMAILAGGASLEQIPGPRAAPLAP